jgi:TRAP-type C4-dicarboxylate transport system permease small subunit
MPPPPSSWRGRGAGLIGGVPATFAGVMLASVMMVTVVDVVGRYAFKRPLPGASEIIEILMALLVYIGLPVVSQRNAHIAVDMFGSITPPALAPARDAVIRILCAGVLGVIAWRLWLYAGQLTRDVTEYLKLPQAPLVYFLSVFAAVAALIEIYRAFRPAPPQDVFAAESA